MAQVQRDIHGSELRFKVQFTVRFNIPADAVHSGYAETKSVSYYVASALELWDRLWKLRRRNQLVEIYAFDRNDVKSRLPPVRLVAGCLPREVDGKKETDYYSWAANNGAPCFDRDRMDDINYVEELAELCWRYLCDRGIAFRHPKKPQPAWLKGRGGRKSATTK